MKKILLLISMFVLLAGTASAQSYYDYEKNVSKPVSTSSNNSFGVEYIGEIDLGYSVGVGEDWASFDRINIHTVHGVKFGQYASTGLGTGLDMFMFDGEVSDYVIPVFVNAKGYLPITSRISPYISCDIGAGFLFDKDFNSADEVGFVCAPAVGILLNCFKVQVGYNLYKFEDLNFGAIQFKIGFVF